MRSALLMLALSGCTGWNTLPDQSLTDLDAPLWDPYGVVPSAHGLYVPLPHAGGLALISRNGSKTKAERIDLGEGRMTRLTASPDGETLVAFVEKTYCDYRGDKKAPTTIRDCKQDDRVYVTELLVIHDGDKVDKPVLLDGLYNAIEWSRDGTYAIAYLDFDDPDLRLDGVVNLTSVVTLDLNRGGLTTPVSVGFAADRVLFIDGAGGAPERAVVLSRNNVAVIDLLPEIPERVVTFPLSLDPDTVVTPIGIELTPDGQYALISVEGRSDLYALDLISESINIIELSGNPTAMVVNPALDRTVLVYGNTATVDILDHDLFDLDSLQLDQPMTDVQSGSDFAVLYNTANGHDAYRVDLATNVLTEYRLQNPAVSMSLSPTEEFAIALTRAENGFNEEGVEGIYDANPGMEILDLNDDKSQPFLLEGNGIGVAWSQTDTELHALILQQEVDYLFQLDLYTGRSEELELTAPPVLIGAMPDNTFFITHNSPMGLVSFLDPITGDLLEVSGFGTIGLADEIELQTLQAKGGK